MRRFLPFLLVLATLACNNSRSAQAAAPEAASQPPPAPAPSSPQINPQRAWTYVKDFVAIGSRKPGTAGHQKAVDFLHSRLKQIGVDVEDDKFTASTPAGQFPLTNIIAKIPGAKDGIIVVASHYETNFPLPDNFVGANDGGSTSGLLLELANVLKTKPGTKRDGYSIWLVFDDGEEAFHEWSDQDSLYGTKHLAQKWQQDGTLKKIKALFVLDMIGDKELDIQRDQNSTPWLEDLVFQAASKYGYQSHFFQTETAVQDDHLPFKQLGVPVADIIDIDYGYNNSFHHTTQDTLDKLSSNSLQIVGDTLLQTISLLDHR